jgi:hypothetical protein
MSAIDGPRLRWGVVVLILQEPTQRLGVGTPQVMIVLPSIDVDVERSVSSASAEKM